MKTKRKHKPTSGALCHPDRAPFAHRLCESCYATYWRNTCSPESRAKHRNYQKDYMLKMNYGVSLEQYQAILDAQGGRCAICLRKATECSKCLAVDHDHVTGKVRGLLCRGCNTTLGWFERPDAEKFRLYLQKHHED